MPSPATRGPFERTVAALADTIGRERLAADPDLIAEAVRFALAQHARMPAHLRAGVRAATVALACAAVLRTGRAFFAAPPAAREACVARWRAARRLPWAAVVRFWESLVVYAVADARGPYGP